MKTHRSAAAGLAALIAVGSWVVVGSGQQPAAGRSTNQAPTSVNPSQLPVLLEPLGESGEAIYPAFEGWGPHKDGTDVLLIGYFNRNKGQVLDIPIGPNNRIEPGGPDYGQPTHFELGRQYGVFAISVPKDFGNKKLTWTLVANGQTAVVQFWRNPPYWVDHFKHGASGNEPPIVKFTPDGPTSTGPPRPVSTQTLSGVVWEPVELKLWASDQKATYVDEEAAPAGGRGAARGGDPAGRGADPAAGRGDAARGRGRGQGDTPVAIIGSQVIGAGGRGGGGGGGGGGGRGAAGPPADIRVSWHKHRGPGDITYDTDEIRLQNNGDPKLFLEAKTNAYFSEPGEYIVRGQVNDASGNGGGGDLCCWTTVYARVNVKGK
jgi:hypothetical protein